MIKLVLLTGFLGAGKTTLMQEMLRVCEGIKTGVIVNEFGEINVDAKLIERDGVKMAELSNGSIFCACIRDKFVDSLIQMSFEDLDYLFIEASGLADPANMNRILAGIRDNLMNPYDYRGSVCIVDGESFLDLYEVLPAITAQLEFCSAAIINKSDLIKEAQLEEILETIRRINADTATYVTSYCRVNAEEIVENLTQNKTEDRDSGNRPETRPVTFVLRGLAQTPYEKLELFLAALSEYAYRIKGFAETDWGVKEISIVGRNIHINDWNGRMNPTEIVVISAVGFKMMSIITKAIETYVKGFIRI